MAADLEFRVGAELSEIRKALAELRAEFGSLGKIKGPSNAFGAVEKDAVAAGAKVDGLGRKVAAVSSQGASNAKPLDGVTKSAETAGVAVDKLGQRVAATNKAKGASQALSGVQKSADAAGKNVDDLTRKVSAANAAKGAAAKPFDGVTKDADRAGRSVDTLRSRIRAALSGGGGGSGSGGRAGGAQNPFRGIESGADSALRQVRNLIAGFATLAGVAGLIRLADEAATLNARLRAVTQSEEEFARAQFQTFEIAQRNGVAIRTVSDLYVRLANATKEAGTSQEVLLQLTETITQATQLQGGSVQSAQAAIEQLGQALSSGTLNGDELRSIREQAPALAEAIAKGLGVATGELRKLGEQGELTTERVIGALAKAAPEIAQRAAQIPLTFARASQQLRNSLFVLVGIFDETAGATGGLATVISDFSKLLSSPETIGSIVQFAATWGEGFRQIVADFGAAIDFLKEGTKDITGTGEDAVQILIRAFRDLPVNVRASVRLVVVGALSAFDQVVAGASFLKEALAAIFNDDTIAAAAARFSQRLATIREAAQATVDETLKDRDDALAAARLAREEAERRRRTGGNPATGNRTLGNFRSTASASAAREAEQVRKAQLDAEEKLFDDSTKRQLGILSNFYSDARLSAAQYFEARQAIELAAANRSIEIERARLATAKPADRAKILADLEILERSKTDIVERAARERAEAQKAVDRQLADLRARELENAGQLAEASRIRSEAQFGDLIARLTAEGNTAGVALINRLIDTDAARAKFDELKTQFDRIIDDLQKRQQQIADQRNAGGLTPAVAEQETSEARQQAEAQLQRLNLQLQELARNTNDPAIVRGANEAAEALRRLAVDGSTGLNRALIDLRASLANLREGFAQTTVSSGVDAIVGLFTDLASGSKSAADSVKDFVRGFVASMAQVAARALATIAVLRILQAAQALGGGGGGGGGILSSVISAAVNHAGGMAGTGPRRQVSPLVFAGAPRFHSGSGQLGLAPDEIPAILQTGERVLNRREASDYNAGGSSGGGGSSVRILNVIDPNLVKQYLNSSAGERTILNVIERNPGAVRQKIA